MKTVKFKDLPEKVQEFLRREAEESYNIKNEESYSINLESLHTLPEWREATDEERLAYAEWRYKDGDTIRKWSGGEGFFTLKKPFKIWGGNVLDQNGVCVYSESHSKFAEIIREPEKEEPTFKAGDEFKWIEPEFIKAGDDRLLLGQLRTPPKIDCRVISEENYQYLLSFAPPEIRKPDPDKVYREIAKEIIVKWDFLREDGKCDPDILSMLIEALKKGKEL